MTEKKITIEDIWAAERANATHYYEADGRYVKEEYDEHGKPTGVYTYMPDSGEWVLGAPSFYVNERVKITKERCEALIDSVEKDN